MYLRALYTLAASGQTTVSSSVIADMLDLDSIVVRKDLAVTGIIGKPRIGFDIQGLIKAIESVIHLQSYSDAFLVGAGNLGIALLGFHGFEQHGLNIVAAFDVDPQKIGTTIHGKKVFPLKRMHELGHRMHISLGILCVPEATAQHVAEMMVAAGIRGIWNFTPVKLKMPENVIVQREDLSAGLAVLSVKLERMFSQEKVTALSVEQAIDEREPSQEST
jgi:redox-sensing transcriptional repressor